MSDEEKLSQNLREINQILDRSNIDICRMKEAFDKYNDAMKLSTCDEQELYINSFRDLTKED